MPVIPWAKIVGIAVIYLAGLASGAWVTHKIDTAAYNKLKADYAEAEVSAAKIEWQKQRDADAVTAKADRDRAESAERIATGLQARLAEVERHEKELLRGCVTFEFVRQLRLYIRNVPGESLALPAGKRPGDCAPISGLRLERRIIEQLGIGRDNADQLNKMIVWARSIEALRPQAAGK